MSDEPGGVEKPSDRCYKRVGRPAGTQQVPGHGEQVGSGAANYSADEVQLGLPKAIIRIVVCQFPRQVAQGCDEFVAPRYSG